jgi:release factor glutamine methyltransferase
MNSRTNQVWTVLSMLEWGTEYFEKMGVDSPRLSVEWLLAHVLNVKRLDIYLQFDRPLSGNELNALRPLIKRRAKHEPLQHIAGSTQFMGCKIYVNQEVLIPRDETEQLVELILEQCKDRKNEPVQLLDIGTGSGCISIAVKSLYPEWGCTGIDISKGALQMARKNASENRVDVEFIDCDINNIDSNDEIAGRQWDIVVSNPPYITHKEKETLDPQVLNFEPDLALFHSNPTELYEKICAFATSKNSRLFLECSNKFADQIVAVAKNYFESVKLLKDLDGNDRFIYSRNPSK